MAATILCNLSSMEVKAGNCSKYLREKYQFSCSSTSPSRESRKESRKELISGNPCYKKQEIIIKIEEKKQMNKLELRQYIIFVELPTMKDYF